MVLSIGSANPDERSVASLKRKSVNDIHEMVSELDSFEGIVMRCTTKSCGRAVAIRSAEAFAVIVPGNENAFHRYTYGPTPEGGVMQPVDAVA